jgi:membrane protease YdiL (CAAX protease family)
MTAITTSTQCQGLASPANLRAWIKCHQLVAYFTLAFAGTWIMIIPLLLSQRGMGLITLPDAGAFFFYFLATYTGPFLSAFVVTGLVTGRPGVRLLLKRIVLWRVGVQWYALILLGYPLVMLVGIIVMLGFTPLAGIAQKWQLFFTAYIPAILVGMLFPGLGEETGWRGFALPRLQMGYGPLAGSLILGFLHAMWHIPAYFVRGMITNGPFDPNIFIANTFAIMASTIVWTWIFNNTRSSVFIAILLHATSNAAGALVTQLATLPYNPWASFEIFGACALLIILFTRGRLSYSEKTAPQDTGLRTADAV